MFRGEDCCGHVGAGHLDLWSSPHPHAPSFMGWGWQGSAAAVPQWAGEDRTGLAGGACQQGGAGCVAWGESIRTVGGVGG